MRRFQALLETKSTQAIQQQSSLSEHSSFHLEQLSEAVTLYQGELLPDFGMADALGFEEWLLLRRKMLLHQQAISAFHALMTEYETVDDYKHVLEVTNRLLALDPYQEGTYPQMMRVLAQMSQSEQARQLFILSSSLYLRDVPDPTPFFERTQER